MALQVVDVEAAIAWMESQVGFLEGPNNDNPYGPWQGVWNASYCDSFAQMGAVQYGGYRWPDKCQFGYKGDAYVPYTETHARELGLWVPFPDLPSLRRGWQPVYDWSGWGGGDHIGGAVLGTDDGWQTFWTVEGNTGSPEGVHYVRRDGKYLRGCVALPQKTAPAPARSFWSQFVPILGS